MTKKQGTVLFCPLPKGSARPEVALHLFGLVLQGGTRSPNAFGVGRGRFRLKQDNAETGAKLDRSAGSNHLLDGVRPSLKRFGRCNPPSVAKVGEVE
jgi:hypothetical protein